MRNLDYCEIRLVKYTKLIDKAIAENRYSLATHLAYRCLLEYQRLAARFILPHPRVSTKNAFQLSIDVVNYLRKHTGPVSLSRTRQLFSLLSTSYQLTRWAKRPFGDRDMYFDLAMATFARENSLQLARFLIGTVHELSPSDLTPDVIPPKS